MVIEKHKRLKGVASIPLRFLRAPFFAEGSIDVHTSDKSPADLLQGLARAIDHAKPRSMDISHQRLTFEAGLFRGVSKWNELGAASRGVIFVNESSDRIHIHYTICFGSLFFFSLTAALFIGCVIGASTGAANVVFPIVVFVLLFGFNYLFTRLNFVAFLRSTAEEILHSNGAQPSTK